MDIEVDSSKFDLLNGGIEIPDPNLEKAIREALELPDDRAITQQDMQQLTRLSAWNSGITDLTGLEHATFLKLLALRGNLIQDLTPIAGLIHLELLTLDRNPISDISPLANLLNLKILRIPRTLVTDYTPLQGLHLTSYVYDEPCIIAPILPPVKERIENRTFPSIFQAWNDVVGLDHLTWEQRNVLHDLHWSPNFETIEWDPTPTEPTEGVAVSLAGPLDHARKVRQRRLDQNPNMAFLLKMRFHSHTETEDFPPDSDLWLRDTQGQIVQNHKGDYLINFLKPEVQDLLVSRIIAVERCGLYDGVFIDGFNRNGTGFVGRNRVPFTDEEIIQVMLNIFHRVRSQVRDGFLIVVNANRSKATRYAEFINGTFMETLTDFLGGVPGGYTRGGLAEIESTLTWSEQNLRYPQTNCLEGWGIPAEPPDSPNNKRWMRGLYHDEPDSF